jgi:hypothetical protein
VERQREELVMAARRPPRIYVAGPYTQGDVAQNVARALHLADWLAREGCAPFVPHLSHFWHMQHAHTWQFWIEQDLQWLAVCDALVRLPGESQGAEVEVIQARALGRPIFEAAGDVAALRDIAAWRAWLSQWPDREAGRVPA